MKAEDATAQFIEIMKAESDRLTAQPRRLRRELLGDRPRLPRRSLGDEGRLLPRRRHEVGHFPGDQAGLTLLVERARIEPRDPGFLPCRIDC